MAAITSTVYFSINYHCNFAPVDLLVPIVRPKSLACPCHQTVSPWPFLGLATLSPWPFLGLEHCGLDSKSGRKRRMMLIISRRQAIKEQSLRVTVLTWIRLIITTEMN